MGQVDGDDRGGLGGREAELVKITRGFVLVFKQHGGTLGRVDGAAAADAEHSAGAELASQSGGFVNAVNRGVGSYFIVVHIFNSVGFKGLQHVIPGAGFLVRAMSGDDKNFADSAGSKFPADIIDFFDGSDAEIAQSAGADQPDFVNVDILFPHVNSSSERYKKTDDEKDTLRKLSQSRS